MIGQTSRVEISWLEKWPELAIASASWLAPVALSWMRWPLVGTPYSLETIAIYIGCFLSVLIPAYIIGRPITSPLRPAAQDLLWNRPSSIWLALGITVMTMLSYILLRREYFGVDTATAREERGQIEYSGWVYRVYLVGALVASVSVTMWSGLRKAWLPFYTVPSVILLVSAVASIVSGARFEMVPLAAMMAVGIAINNIHKWAAKPIRTSIITLLPFAAWIVVNSAFNVYGTKGGANSQTAVYLQNVGGLFLELFGIEDTSPAVERAFGSVSEYVAAPLPFFDYYIASNTFPPTHGAHQFSNLLIRLGMESAVVTKEGVDDLYTELGIMSNVWATAVREMMIDFGFFGAFVECAVIGCLIGLSKRRARENLAARHLYLMLTSYLIAAPLTSFSKSILFEVGIYGAILWFGYTCFFSRTGSLRRLAIKPDAAKVLTTTQSLN